MMTQQIRQVIPDAIQRASEITPYHVEKLSPSELAMVKLSIPSDKNPKICDMDAINMAVFAGKIRKDIVLRLGLNITKEEDEAEVKFVSEIAKHIVKHKNLTKNEIICAVDKALDGDFLIEGQTFVHFTLANFSLWIKAYIKTKAPVMSKHLQLIHQVKEPVIELSDEERVKLACGVANMYARDRRADPSHRVAGGAVLWQNIEDLRIFTMQQEDRVALVKLFKGLYPEATESEIVIHCQNAAYNMLIADLVEMDMMLDDEGKAVKIEC
jgi:hypothetical protein